MKKEKYVNNIMKEFSKIAKKEKNIKSSFLFVHSNKLDIHINISETNNQNLISSVNQPYYTASVGKLFTAIIICMLIEKNLLSFNDYITKYLTNGIIYKLHRYEYTDYTNEIKIKHLINHSSGLFDIFYPMLDKLLKDSTFSISPQEIILCGKKYLDSKNKPGENYYFSDTNYIILGLIIEKLLEKPFYEVIKEYIFEKCDMRNSHVLHLSEPIEKTNYDIADFYYNNFNLNNCVGLGKIDYAGGGVVSTSKDLFKFMYMLNNEKIIKKITLSKLLEYVNIPENEISSFGIKTSSKNKYITWGAYGEISSFVLYHEETDSYIIGNFNDHSNINNIEKFINRSIINNLLKLKSKKYYNNKEALINDLQLAETK